MSDNIDFKNGADSGEIDEESISPVKFGEPALPQYFNRPTEALRNRTEVLRIEANENRWVRDADRAIALWLDEAAEVSWETYATAGAGNSAVGLFLSGGPLYVASLLGPGESRDSEYEFSGTKFPSRRAHAVLEFSNGVDLRVRSERLHVEGGNEISIEFVVDEEMADGHLITVTGSTDADPATQPGRDNIKVSLGHTNPSTYDAILASISSDSTVADLITVDVASGDSSLEAQEVGRTHLEGGLDGVFHQIPPASIDADSLDLQEGDCLAIWYDSIRLRRESVESMGNNHILGSASIINLSKAPEKAANAIPLGRVLNGRFVWANGAVMEPESTLQRLHEVRGSQVGFDDENTTSITADNVQDALESLDTDIVTINEDIDDQGDVLTNHNNTLNDHENTLDNHDGTLAGHTTTLGDHGDRLDANEITLNNHDGELDDLQDQVDERLRVFDSLQDLITTLPVGDAGVVAPVDLARDFGERLWEVDHAEAEIQAMATDGRYVYVFDADDGAYAIDSATGDIAHTYNTNVNGTSKHVATNGEVVAFSAEGSVEFFNVQGAAAIGGYDAVSGQGDFVDIAMGRDNLFIIDEESPGSIRVSLSDFSNTLLSYGIVGDYQKLVCTGGFVYAFGKADAESVNVVARVPTDTTSFTFDSGIYGEGKDLSDAVTDGTNLYVATTDGDVQSLPVVRYETIEDPEWVIETGITIPKLCVDQRYLYFTDTSSGVLYVYNKKSRKRAYEFDTSTFEDDVNGVVADGESFFLKCKYDPPSSTLARFHAGHLHTIFAHVGNQFRDNYVFNHAAVPITDASDAYQLPKEVEFDNVTTEDVEATNQVIAPNAPIALLSVDNTAWDGSLEWSGYNIVDVTIDNDERYLVELDRNISPDSVIQATRAGSGFLTVQAQHIDSSNSISTGNIIAVSFHEESTGKYQPSSFSLTVYDMDG